MQKALLLDHDDSFTFNVKVWLESHFDVSLFRHTEINNINPDNYDLIVLSPGPNSPEAYPDTLSFVKNLSDSKPVLGICLGMQIINTVEGGQITRYTPPQHGKTTFLKSSDLRLNELTVGRYHSLKCLTNINHFNVIATTDSDIAMIIKHKTKNWLGYQFHPESFLTQNPDIFLSYVVETLIRSKLCNP